MGTKKPRIPVVYKGEKFRSVNSLAKHLGIAPSTLYKRINVGDTDERLTRKPDARLRESTAKNPRPLRKAEIHAYPKAPIGWGGFGLD